METLVLWIAGAKGQAVIAGALGGVVRWLSVKEGWRQGLVSVVVGAICALYLGPLAVPALEPIIGTIVVDPASQAGFSGFVLGLGGVGVVGFVLDFWRAKRRKGSGNDDEGE